MKELIYIILTVIAGVAVAVQSPINTLLGKNIKSVEGATLLSFIIGGVFMLAFMLIRGVPFPSLDLMKATPIWTYLGGLLGLTFVSLVIIVIPQLGVGTATVILLFTQIFVALILDHFGLFGLESRPINISKIIGVVSIAVGIFFVNK